MTETNTRRVRVVIVNFRSADLLARCVASLTSPLIDAITVRNNDADTAEVDLLAELADADPRVHVLPDEGNPGFGPAVNQAVAAVPAADDDIVWVLNPDIEVHDGAVEHLVDVVDRDPNTVVSPVIWTEYSPGSPVVWYAGGDFDRLAGRTQHRKELARDVEVDDSSTFMTGAAMMQTRDTWDRIGGFREDLFLYWEDADLSLRIHDLGVKMAVCAAATVWHHVGGSSKASGKRARYCYYMQRNRLWVCSQFTTWQTLLFGSGRGMTLRLLKWPLRHRGVRFKGLGYSVRGIVEGVVTRPQPSRRSASPVRAREG